VLQKPDELISTGYYLNLGLLVQFSVFIGVSTIHIFGDASSQHHFRLSQIRQMGGEKVCIFFSDSFSSFLGIF
jgi:hypothetical protein